MTKIFWKHDVSHKISLCCSSYVKSMHALGGLIGPFPGCLTMLNWGSSLPLTCKVMMSNLWFMAGTGLWWLILQGSSRTP
jgi:hypothetical protein